MPLDVRATVQVRVLPTQPRVATPEAIQDTGTLIEVKVLHTADGAIGHFDNQAAQIPYATQHK